MSKSLKKYIETPLIKADNGQTLMEYWFEAYRDQETYMSYDDKAIDKALKKNLEVLMGSKKALSSIFKGFVFEVMTEKAEIYLTHCLVLNKVRNERLDIIDNPVFQELIEDFKKSKACNAVFNKVIIEFNEK
jgi:hypothetical protein